MNSFQQTQYIPQNMHMVFLSFRLMTRVLSNLLNCIDRMHLITHSTPWAVLLFCGKQTVFTKKLSFAKKVEYMQCIP